ncbi:VOC family protein [Halocola ammonii]
MYKRINGIQHVGVAVKDMDASLKFYRKFFGLDIPFFDDEAEAPLMRYYTKNETITKRASMVMNLQGGCAMEVIRATSFDPRPAVFDTRLGDLGIYITQVKCRDLDATYKFCKEEDCNLLTEISERPNGDRTFYLTDLEGNVFQYLEHDEWYSKNGHHSGGVLGCTIGVSDMEKAFSLYKNILGFDRVIYDESKVFDDFKGGVTGGENKMRRVLLTQSKQPGGGFARVTGSTYIELVQVLDREPRKIFDDRIWADLGFVHLGFDVKGMERLGEELKKEGFGFTCDSDEALDMGTTKVHCTYIDDPDETWIELIEVYKVPIIEKWGIYLNVEKRDPLKPLPNYMLKALRFSRIKD